MRALMSPRNPLVQQIRELVRDRKAREQTGLAVLEGIRLAEEALAAGLPLESALVSEQLCDRGRGAALLDALGAANVPLYFVAAQTLNRAANTQTPQGIMLLFRPRIWSLAELGQGLVLALDNLQDPGNLGTVIRSLEAMRGGGLVVAGGVDPYNPKVVRAAMGSLFRIPVVKAELKSSLHTMRQKGKRIYVADSGGPLYPWTRDLTGEVVLVIGNEGAGPSAEALALADGVISIPMPGRAESLNAGVAASLLIYEAMRQQLWQ